MRFLWQVFVILQNVIKNHTNGQQKSLWDAAVSWYMPHDCFVWFGKPTQVWASVTFPGYSVGCIQSRVLYTQAQVNFGRVIGLDTVVPLNVFVAPQAIPRTRTTPTLPCVALWLAGKKMALSLGDFYRATQPARRSSTGGGSPWFSAVEPPGLCVQLPATPCSS